MPQEIRHIIFSQSELREKIFELLASRGDKRRIGESRIELEPDEQEQPVITMHYVGLAPGERSTLSLAGREALTAAILYCRSRHVPLPMRADKSLAIVRGHLTLVLSLRAPAPAG